MAKKQVVVIGSDHAGYRTKEAIKKALAGDGYEIVDVGGFDPSGSDDYPPYAKDVADAVASDKSVKGILVCGSGTGMVIAANKVKGIRASVVYDAYSARMARHDNDANVIALRGRKFPQRDAVRFARLFLKTEFSGIDRHKRRINQIRRMER